MLKISGKDVFLELVPDSKYQSKEAKEKRKLYYGIILKYHSYVASRHHVGRHIGFLIYYKNEIIGCIGFGSYLLPEPSILKKWIGWNKEKYNRGFNSISINWKFTMMKHVPNLASKVLSLCSKILPRLWREKYGDKLVLLVSLVGSGKNGTIYRAANWIYLGQTCGSSQHGSISVSKKWAKEKKFQYGGSYRRDPKEQKLIFVKPLHPHWKLILNMT